MSDGVAEIQDLAKPLLLLILFNDPALDPERHLYDPLDPVPADRLIVLFFEEPEQLLVKSHRHFQRFRESLRDQARRKRREDVRVDQHLFRLVEGSDHVLDPVEVDRCLAADRGVHL